VAKEKGNWKPSHWKPGKLARYILHVRKQAIWAACQIVGPHEGNKIAAQLTAEYNERKSVAILKAKGVRLLGDEK
jgi:hypothetical protein